MAIQSFVDLKDYVGSRALTSGYAICVDSKGRLTQSGFSTFVSQVQQAAITAAVSGYTSADAANSVSNAAALNNLAAVVNNINQALKALNFTA